MFRALTAVGAQTEEYAERFRALGVPKDRILVTDTMKWDTVKLVEEVSGAAALRAAMGIDPTRPLVVAGSTGPGEEEMLLAGKPPEVQLMLVPRKPERFDEVFRLAPGMVRRSQRPDGTEGEINAQGLFLLDTMGELTRAFALADVAVVGRSFVPMGGSDPIEAIALGRPTIMGPHHDNFRDVVSAFTAAGAIRVTDRPMEEALALLGDPEARRRMGEAGKRVIRERQGATRRNAELLHRLIESATKGGASDRGTAGGRTPPSGFLRRWVLPAILLYLAAGWCTTAFRRVPFQEAGPPTADLPATRGRLVSGVFSVHTDRSHDAKGSREEVAAAAVAAGLDFVVIGDHPPDDRKPGWDFWAPALLDGVLVEGGQELRSPEAGKILAVAVDTTYRQWRGDYASFTDMLRREKATSFVVHGRGPRGSERWVSPSVDGVQGWEVLDLSEFARARLSGFWSLYHGLTLVLGTPVGLGDEALRHLMREGFDTPAAAAYDSFRVSGPLTATAGLNVHPKMRVGSILVPSYEMFFRTLVTHIRVESWTAGGRGAAGDPVNVGAPANAADPVKGSNSINAPGLRTAPGPETGQGALAASESLMAGAQSGEVFISVADVPRARSFRLGVVEEGRVAAVMGGVTAYSGSALLRAGFSDGSRGGMLYRVLRNGEEVAWILGPGLEWRVPEPGVYRVEVYTYSARLGRTFFRLRPWIFGNPVTVLSPSS